MPFYTTVVRIMGFRVLKNKEGKYFVKLTSKSKVRRIVKERNKNEHTVG